MDVNKPEQNNKPLLIVFIIVLIAILGLGAYYLSVQQKISKNSSSSKNANNNAYDYDNAKRASDAIFIKSAIYNYDPVFVNKPELIDLVKKWGIYTRGYLKGSKVSKVTIILTSSLFKDYTIDNGKGEVISSDSVSFYTDELNILVYVNPKFLDTNPTAFEDGALFALFAFGNASDKPTIETKRPDFKKFLDEKHAKNQTYIKLKKF